MDKAATYVKVTREVPLWGILSVIGAAVLNTVSQHYNQQGMAKEMVAQREQFTSVAADVRAITIEINKGALASVEQRLKLEALERRLAAVEATQAAQQQRRGNQ